MLNLKKANTFNAYRTSGHSSVVERLVANEKVVGSSPIARSKLMLNIYSKFFQNYITEKNIRDYKKSIFYYFFFRLIRKRLKGNFKVKIHNFYIWASSNPDKQSYSILRKCDFEDLNELNLIKKIYKNNSIFLLDCGANFGFYSLFSASLSTTNKILSFEASTKTYKDLVNNIELNNFKNIKPFNLAILDKDNEIVSLNESKKDWESSILHDDFELLKKSKTKTIKIDTILKKENLNDKNVILKIDIEGNEMQAIYGAQDCIKKHSPLIIIEFSKYIRQNLSKGYKDLEEFLHEYKYEIYDATYKKISMIDVYNRLEKLPKNMYGIGNNFLIKKDSIIEDILKK